MVGAKTAKTYQVPQPYASPDTRRMLNTVVFKAQALDLEQSLPNGSYDFYPWLMDNFQPNWHCFEVMAEGYPVAQQVGQLSVGHWRRYGPYQVDGTQGALSLKISAQSANIDAHLMGLSIFQKVAD